METPVRGTDLRKVAPSPVRSPSPTTDAGAILQLQALAGNRAVADLMQAVVQRKVSTDGEVAALTTIQKLVDAYERADIDEALRKKIQSVLSPEALAAAVIAAAVVFVGSQFTPVGWAADIGIALTAIFVTSAVWTATEHLVNFAAARNAKTTAELDQAGAEFAAAIAEIGVDAIILFLTHSVGGSGGRPHNGSTPPTGLVLATAGGRVVPVAAETIPASVAAELGLRAVGASSPLTGALMMAANNNGQGGSRSGEAPKSAGGPEEAPARGGWDRDAILEEFEEAQQKVGPGAHEKDVLEQPGVSDRRTPGGRPQPRSAEVGNFGHTYAEQLIPEAEMPRGLDKEVNLTDRGGPVGRPDRVDWQKGVFYEVKPNTAQRIAEGWEQVRRYIYYLNKSHPLGNGRSWEGRVVTYDYPAARRILFGK